MTPVGGPIHVLHITAVAASNEYLNSLAEFSDPAAVRFHAVTLGPAGGFTEALRRRGVDARALDVSGRIDYPRTTFALRRLIFDEGIDLVHGHLFEPTLLAIAAAKYTGRPVVVTRHHSDAIHRLPGRARRWLYRCFEAWINRSARHIIAPSRRVHEVLTATEGVPIAKVSLIPYGQTLARFADLGADEVSRIRAALKMEGRFSIVCISRLHGEKGHLFLLHAFAALTRDAPDAFLYLVGTGPARADLERCVVQLGLQRSVAFLGWREDALSIIAAADMVVHPSLHEALPSAVIEAAILEKPILATDVSGVRDILGDADPHGLIVPPADSEALLKGMRSIRGDPEGARGRGRGARERVLREMDPRRVAQAHTDCYRRVLKATS